MGYYDNAFPFSFAGYENRPSGYSVELCNLIASAIQLQLALPELQVKWQPLTMDNRFAMVIKGAVDIECGTTTNTLSHQEQVDFSTMTFVDGGSLLTRLGLNIKTPKDLQGKRIALIPGTTTEEKLLSLIENEKLKTKLLSVKDHAEGLAMLNKGKIDAYASDRGILIGLALTGKHENKLQISDFYFSYEPYGLMFRRNDADFRFAVNRVLSRLYRSGSIIEIHKKWFAPFSPNPLLRAMYLINGLPE